MKNMTRLQLSYAIQTLWLAALVVATSSGSIRADGGLVRWFGDEGPYRITVFTSPTPLRAGPVDFSVLVQDVRTGRELHDAQVTIRVASEKQLLTGASGHAATAGAATNKLLSAATFELPRAGHWSAAVDVIGPQGRAETRFDFEAAEAFPPWRREWPWFSWPLLPVVLFGLRQWFAPASGSR
jgi:hypothetical protein